MALTPLSESLQVSGSGFDALLGAIQNEVNRVQQNRDFTRQIEAQKDLSLFKADLEFDMEKRKQDELYPDRLNLEMEQMIRQARFQDDLSQERESRQFDRDISKLLLTDKLQRDAIELEAEGQSVQGPSFSDLDVAKDRRERRIDNLYGDMFGDPDFAVQPAEAIGPNEKGTWLYRVNKHPFLPGRVQPDIVTESELYNFYGEQAKIHSAIKTIRSIAESDDVLEYGDRVERGREYIGRSKARSLLGELTKPISDDLDAVTGGKELDSRYSLAQDILSSEYRPLRRSETITNFDENVEVLVSRLISTVRDNDLFTDEDRLEGLTLSKVKNKIDEKISGLDPEADANKIGRLNNIYQQIDDLQVGLGTTKGFTDKDINNLYIHSEQFDVNRHNLQKLFGSKPQKFEDVNNVGESFFDKWINPFN